METGERESSWWEEGGEGAPTNQGRGGECFGRGSANRKEWILDKVGGKLVRIRCAGIAEDSKFVRFLIWSTLWMLLASLIAQLVKGPPAMQETAVQFLGREDLLEKG